jgi:hypothetical protein
MKNILIFFLIITINTQAQVIPISFIKSSTIPFLYPTVTIGAQVWMANNLDVETYQNGNGIDEKSSGSDWTGASYGAWCYPNGNSNNNSTYGKLYNWLAVTDSRNICPEGSRVPTNDDWDALDIHLNNNSGDISRFGFDKGGYRSSGDGSFNDFNTRSYFWSSNQSSLSSSAGEVYSTTDGSNFSKFNGGYGLNKKSGASVRCIVR